MLASARVKLWQTAMQLTGPPRRPPRCLRHIGRAPDGALPLDRALARVCREAGARVARNVRVVDMNIDVPSVMHGA